VRHRGVTAAQLCSRPVLIGLWRAGRGRRERGGRGGGGGDRERERERERPSENEKRCVRVRAEAWEKGGAGNGRDEHACKLWVDACLHQL
jgi:hypothetical protein